MSGKDEMNHNTYRLLLLIQFRNRYKSVWKIFKTPQRQKILQSNNKKNRNLLTIQPPLITNRTQALRQKAAHRPATPRTSLQGSYRRTVSEAHIRIRTVFALLEDVRHAGDFERGFGSGVHRRRSGAVLVRGGGGRVCDGGVVDRSRGVMRSLMTLVMRLPLLPLLLLPLLLALLDHIPFAIMRVEGDDIEAFGNFRRDPTDGFFERRTSGTRRWELTFRTR